MKHAEDLLQAYADGELGPRTRARVASHLEKCKACRAELGALASLSTLLRSTPGVDHTLPDDAFASQVMLRLPREGQPTISERTVGWAWRLAPAAIVGAWFFGQTAAILAALLRVLLQTQIGDAIRAALPMLAAPQRGVGQGWMGAIAAGLGLEQTWSAVASLSGLGVAVTWPAVSAALTAAAIGSWFAIGWVRARASISDVP